MGASGRDVRGRKARVLLGRGPLDAERRDPHPDATGLLDPPALPVDGDQVVAASVDENDCAIALRKAGSGEKKRKQSARESSHVRGIIQKLEAGLPAASVMSGPNDRRAATPPHCYRVVQLGFALEADAARPLAERTSGEISHGGKRIRACTLFEPKVGGGGHLLLLDEEAGTTWARVLIEPEGIMLSMVAAFLEGDWESSDETLAHRIREWMATLLGVAASSMVDGGGNGTGHVSDPPHGP